MNKPNVLVILCDQMRRSAMSCAGNPDICTPHIDAIAERGVRFGKAYSTYPICVPTRFTLMTGEYAHSRMVPGIGWRMSPAERTLAHEFNDAGYETAYIGKWHLYGSNQNLGHLRELAANTAVPRTYQGGFTYWRGFELCNRPFDTRYFVDGDPVPRKLEGYQTDGLFALASEFIANRSQTEEEKPFFMILSVEPPHDQFDAPAKYREKWTNREVAVSPNVDLEQNYYLRSPGSKHILDDLRCYYAMIENLDDNIGRLQSLLQQQGQLENTAIVFLSDHGELMGAHGLIGKKYPYEESTGVPFIVSHPQGGIGAGVVVQEPTCTEDWFPTILGLADLMPQSPKFGENLVPLMRGERDRSNRAGVMLEFVAETRDKFSLKDKTYRGYCTEQYKYTVLGDHSGGVPWQLYDLHNDPYEQVNLVDSPDHVSIASELHALLRNRMIETEDDYVLKPVFGHDGLNEWYHYQA